MHVIRLTATAGPDGILRLMVPVGDAGAYDLVVTASLAGKGSAGPKKGTPRGANPGDLGWTAGVGEDAGHSIDDTFFGDMDTDKKPDALGGLS